MGKLKKTKEEGDCTRKFATWIYVYVGDGRRSSWVQPLYNKNTLDNRDDKGQ